MNLVWAILVRIRRQPLHPRRHQQGKCCDWCHMIAEFVNLQRWQSSIMKMPVLGAKLGFIQLQGAMWTCASHILSNLNPIQACGKISRGWKLRNFCPNSFCPTAFVQTWGSCKRKGRVWGFLSGRFLDFQWADTDDGCCCCCAFR